MSTGFDATRKMVSGDAANTAGTNPAKISALRVSRSSRLSPGFWLAPAASTRPVEIGRLPGADPDRICPRCGVQNVLRLGCREVYVAIDEHDLRTDATHRHGISGRGADLPGADNPDLHAVPPNELDGIFRQQHAKTMLPWPHF